MAIKKIITLLFIIFILAYKAYAGPYIKIQDLKIYPKFASSNIEVLVQIRNLNKFNLVDLDEENLLLYEDGYRVNYVNVKN